MSNQTVQQIKAQIMQIKTNVERLVNHELPALPQFDEKANAIQKTRHESIQEYEKCEIKAAHKLYEGMINGIENDYENSLSLIHDHVQKFILFKMNELFDNFPEYADYFRSQSENVPFLNCMNMMNQEEENNERKNKEVSVSLGQGPLMTRDEIENYYNDFSDEKFSIQNGKILKGGNEFLKGGDSITLQLKESLCYNGTIQQIHTEFVEISTESNTVKVPIFALNVGIVTLTKV
ncbi:hypothetical protein TRFO_02900 [Tritrichomonas foetus]|uniref:Uncharacterized protein n=1 Tax=Tritrichomonas foetus TaxID=1144522 RepID=A0A1J4KWL1_9EUKA|nr:hypothetical protein TRFO_02900 [Tritrichomonas foetus]|eukprot:OHT15554.1 hypothetical protein TRFO_02900 [Tritrichomonas foetus]